MKYSNEVCPKEGRAAIAPKKIARIRREFFAPEKVRVIKSSFGEDFCSQQGFGRNYRKGVPTTALSRELYPIVGRLSM